MTGRTLPRRNPDQPTVQHQAAPSAMECTSRDRNLWPEHPRSIRLHVFPTSTCVVDLPTNSTHCSLAGPGGTTHKVGLTPHLCTLTALHRPAFVQSSCNRSRQRKHAPSPSLGRARYRGPRRNRASRQTVRVRRRRPGLVARPSQCANPFVTLRRLRSAVVQAILPWPDASSKLASMSDFSTFEVIAIWCAISLNPYRQRHSPPAASQKP